MPPLVRGVISANMRARPSEFAADAAASGDHGVGRGFLAAAGFGDAAGTADSVRWASAPPGSRVAALRGAVADALTAAGANPQAAVATELPPLVHSPEGSVALVVGGRPYMLWFMRHLARPRGGDVWTVRDHTGRQLEPLLCRAGCGPTHFLIAYAARAGVPPSAHIDYELTLQCGGGAGPVAGVARAFGCPPFRFARGVEAGCAHEQLWRGATLELSAAVE